MRMNSLEIFLNQTDGPHLGYLSSDYFEDLARECRSKNITFLLLNKVSTKEKLLDFLNSNLDFPNYFGFNWDALFDLLREKSFNESVVSSKGICFAYKNVKEILYNNPIEFQKFVSVINDLTKYQTDEFFFKLVVDTDAKTISEYFINDLCDESGQKIEIALIVLNSSS